MHVWAQCLFILTSLERVSGGGGGECLARQVLAEVVSAIHKSSLYSEQSKPSLGFFWLVWGTPAAGEANGTGHSPSSHLWPSGVYLPCLSVSSLDQYVVGFILHGGSAALSLHTSVNTLVFLFLFFLVLNFWSGKGTCWIHLLSSLNCDKHSHICSAIWTSFLLVYYTTSCSLLKQLFRGLFFSNLNFRLWDNNLSFC